MDEDRTIPKVSNPPPARLLICLFRVQVPAVAPLFQALRTIFPTPQKPLHTMPHTTIFSPCRKYRYTLWRDFHDGDFCFDTSSPSLGYVQFIGLNPSTADETKDDPTIRRCIQFAKDWGYGALCMTNLFAWRDTDPRKMKAVENPIGENYQNDFHLYDLASKAGLVVCAWGRDGNHQGRGKFVIARLKEVAESKLHHLGLNDDGSPKHPLYLRSDTLPQPLFPPTPAYQSPAESQPA